MTSRLLMLAQQLDQATLRQVFTHSSWAVDRVHSYERFEFLGDSVLSLCITTELYRRFPDFSEGHLARLRAYIVSRATCAKSANLGLGKMMRQYAARAARAARRPSWEQRERACRPHRVAHRRALPDLRLRGGASGVVEAFDEHIVFAEKSYVDIRRSCRSTWRAAASGRLPRAGLQRAAARPRVRGRGRRRRRVAGSWERRQQEARRAGGGGRGAARAVQGRGSAAGRGWAPVAAAAGARPPARPRAGRRRERPRRRRRPGADRRPARRLSCIFALRLKGFKSFPKQTELLFEPGVPWSSGRTAAARATSVKPSCGRSASRAHQCARLQHAGRDLRRFRRPPRQWPAEVELTFDNSDGVLPLPTPEVSVGAPRRRATVNRSTSSIALPAGSPTSSS